MPRATQRPGYCLHDCAAILWHPGVSAAEVIELRLLARSCLSAMSVFTADIGGKADYGRTPPNRRR